jgi:hypothetical protein
VLLATAAVVAARAPARLLRVQALLAVAREAARWGAVAAAVELAVAAATAAHRHLQARALAQAREAAAPWGEVAAVAAAAAAAVAAAAERAVTAMGVALRPMAS